MISLPSSKKFEQLFCRCYKGDTAYSSTSENLNEEQTTAGAGGAAVGNNSSGNIVNVTSSDVNALIANQNVSEHAIDVTGSTAAYALEALEQSQANSNIVVAAAISSNVAAAHDAENTAVALGTQSQNLASQVAAGAGFGSQVTINPASVENNGSGSSNDTFLGLNLSTWAIIATIAAGAATAWYYFNHRNK